MTREEAIEVLRRLPIGLMDLSCEQKSDLTEALNIALAALRVPTREQVETIKGEWVDEYIGVSSCKCTKCGITQEYESTFCAYCGAPMTDEAVEITLQRLEALYGEP